MSINREQVEHIAELAKLDLTEDEIALYTEQLSDILAYMEQLRELDTSAIPPTASVLPLTNVMRPDKSEPCLPTNVALANTADSASGQFRVDAVLDESP